MPHRAPGHVYKLILIPPAQQDFFATPRDQILGAIKPGNRATKYNREWIVGQTEIVDDVLSGRIGFQGEEGLAEIWDDELQDFVPTAVPSGLTAPFAIDLRDFALAVQPRGSQIKVNSIRVALETLLRDSGFRWTIEGYQTPISFGAWKDSVDRVVSVKLTIRTPNPHYHDAKSVQDIMEQLGSDVTQLEARSETGIDMDAPIVVESQAHVERGYGESEYKGLRAEGSEVRETIYTSGVGAEEQSQEADVDPESGEVPTHKLREILAEATPRVEDEGHGDAS